GMDRRKSNEVSTVVDSILDWRDADNLRRTHGAESEFYLKRRPPYRAKNGLFDSHEELLRVRGVTPALYYGSDGMPGFRDVFSVYSRSPNIHLRSAPAAVLQALLGVDADTAADLVAQRETDETGFKQQVTAQLTDPHLLQLTEPEEGPRAPRGPTRCPPSSELRSGARRSPRRCSPSRASTGWTRAVPTSACRVPTRRSTASCSRRPRARTSRRCSSTRWST